MNYEGTFNTACAAIQEGLRIRAEEMAKNYTGLYTAADLLVEFLDLVRNNLTMIPKSEFKPGRLNNYLLGAFERTEAVLPYLLGVSISPEEFPPASVAVPDPEPQDFDDEYLRNTENTVVFDWNRRSPLLFDVDSIERTAEETARY